MISKTVSLDQETVDYVREQKYIFNFSRFIRRQVSELKYRKLIYEFVKTDFKE